MSMGYTVRNVDLSSAFEYYELVPPGTRVRALLVTKFPAGTDLQISIGGQGFFYLPSTGSLEFEPSDYEATANGVKLTNGIAQAGTVVQFVIIPVGG